MFHNFCNCPKTYKHINFERKNNSIFKKSRGKPTVLDKQSNHVSSTVFNKIIKYPFKNLKIKQYLNAYPKITIKTHCTVYQNQLNQRDGENY